VNVVDFPGVKKLLEPRVLTPEERTQCLLLATMHDERAEVCARDQAALRKFFEMNAEFLRSLAQ
jgi:hypothetical protein